MALTGVGSQNNLYQTLYQKSLLNKNSRKAKKEEIQEKKTDKVEISSKQEVKLSKRAEKYLENLKKKYKNMDFTVANYSSEEEAKQLMANGTKDYSVLIDPETLEEMASNKEVGQKYENVISSATADLSKAREQLEKDGEQVKSLGITIDKDGIVKYFAEVDKQTKAQAENQKKNDKNQKNETLKATANSIEELIEKIREARKEEEKAQQKKEKEYVPFEALM